MSIESCTRCQKTFNSKDEDKIYPAGGGPTHFKCELNELKKSEGSSSEWDWSLGSQCLVSILVSAAAYFLYTGNGYGLR